MVIKTRVFCVAGILLCGMSMGARANELREAAQPSRITLRALLESATMSGVTVSPNGLFVSVRVERPSLAANSVTLQWFILSAHNGRVVAKVDGGEPDWIPSGDFAKEVPQWSADSQWLYFRMLRGGKLALWRLGLNGHVEEVISGPSDVDGFSLDNEHDGIFYWTGPSRRSLRDAKRTEYQRGVILDGTQYFSAPLENNWPYRSGITGVRLLHRFGKWLWLPAGDDGSRRSMVYDQKTGRSHVAALPQGSYPADLTYDYESDGIRTTDVVGEVGSVISSARSPRSDDIAFIAYENSSARDTFGHHASPYILGLKKARGNSIVWCKNLKCQDLTGGVVWRPGTDEFVFTTARAPRHAGANAWKILKMYAWNEATGKIRMVFHTRDAIGPNGGSISNQCPANNVDAVCVMEGAADPPILATIDLDGGGVHDLFDPNAKLRGLIKEAGIQAHTRHLIWQDERGLAHTGIFISSSLSRNKRITPPLVITSYVCTGFLRGGTGWTVPEFVLWESGFAVLCTNADDDLSAPTFRSEHVSPGQVTRMEYMFDGWKSAVRILAGKGLVDRRRVGISGLSFTGETVNYVITHHPHFAAAATAGHLDATDPIDFYIAGGWGPSGHAVIRGYGLLDPRTPAGIRYYRVASDALNAERICAPLLVQTDEGEFAHGIQYYGALRLDKAPAEVISFPDESHLFWQPQNRLVMEKRNIDWFRFWLQNYESPDPAKRARYARWERIRVRIRPSCRADTTG